MYKAVIFDFDYTLGDTTDGIVKSVDYALEYLGYAAKSVSEIRRTIGLSLKQTFAALTDCHDNEQAERFAKLFRKKADEVMTESAVLYDCVPEILRELHKTRKIGIVTTKFHYRIEAILRKFSVRKSVDVIIGGEDVKEEKPSPEGLLKAVDMLGLEKREVLYVGDSYIDAAAAQSAGIDFAAVLTGMTTDFSGYKSVCVAKNLRGIFDFVTKQ